jgi:hypothetical protein
MSAWNRSGIAAASSSSWSTVAVGRSGTTHRSYPVRRHGFLLKNSSCLTAVLRIARSRAYDRAAMHSDRRPLRSAARQLLTAAGRISASSK